MRSITTFRYQLVLLAGLCTAAPVSAASWAEGMFEQLSKDFGSVPRGPTLSHPFTLTNNTGGPVHIARVRVSCGCVSARAVKDDLAPGESTAIQAEMDTGRFRGVKKVTIFVLFDQPSWQEVSLSVRADGRDDLKLSPDELSLGRVQRGNSPKTSVTVTFLGHARAEITEVERESHYVQTALKEVRRGAGEVSYELTASIRADAPVGKWHTDLWLKTNNPALPKVRVPLTVQIEPALSSGPPPSTSAKSDRATKRNVN